MLKSIFNKLTGRTQSTQVEEAPQVITHIEGFDAVTPEEIQFYEVRRQSKKAAKQLRAERKRKGSTKYPNRSEYIKARFSSCDDLHI